MNVFFVQREGVDLHKTLLASETSRIVLGFYHPQDFHGGMTISAATLGSALSLVIELRWYIRRYMQDVLFEVTGGVYYTLALAREIYYDRTSAPDTGWPFQRVYTISNGFPVSSEPLAEVMTVNSINVTSPGISRFVVWCTEAEYNEPWKRKPRPKETSTGEGPDEPDA